MVRGRFTARTPISAGPTIERMMISLAYEDEFVGRLEELELLSEEFRSACGEHARFVSVEGEAGIGKSRLVREFAARLDDAALAAFGECVEQIRRPYLPIEQLLERFGRRPPRARVALGRRTRAEERAAYFEAVAETLCRESTRKPLLIVVEDAQWADDATIDLLRYLVGAVAGARVLAIVTFRTSGMLQNAPLSALRLSLARARGSTMSLRGLRRYDIKNLVGKITRARAAELPPQLVAKIEGLCDGNPLFAQELTNIAIESGDIVLGGYMPLSAEAMLSERLTTFSESQRAILIRAAIVGQSFDAAFVAEIAATDLESVLTTAQRAVEHELLLADHRDHNRFTFRHSLIRRALADRLVLGLAAPLHLRIAQAIEHGPEAASRAAELAYHYSEARVAEKARYYNELAGQAAWDVYAYRDAIHFYSAALQWEYPPGLARAAIYERLGTLLYIDGVGEEPVRWFERARNEYQILENAIGESRALLMIADQRWVDARTSESLRAAVEAAANLERLGETQLRVQAMLSVARYAVTLGNAVQASTQLRAVSRLQAHFDAVSRVTFHEVRAEARGALGDTAGALADGEEAVRLAAETGSSELIAQVENNVALVAADLGELERAAEHHRKALAEAHRTALMWRVAYSALNYAQTLAWSGELMRARALIVQALECGVTTATFKTKAAAVGIPLALMLNDRSLLSACSDEAALNYARRSRELQRVASTGAAFAELRRAHGAEGEAREILDATIGHAPYGHRAWNLWLHVGLWGGPDDLALARTVLAGSTGRPRMRRAYAILLEALALRGEPNRRFQRLARLGERAFAAMGFRWQAALCAELAEDRERARQAYTAMGAVRDAERLAEPLEAIRKPNDLTVRQAQIAELVAQGEINRTIAAKLHISEHTVEHHLTSIFARVGVKSRAQLIARWIAPAGQ
jgi:DNA-binding CsgD family transcriptional regulator